MPASCKRFEPDLVSEHLAWSVADGAYLNDLLPLRYDEAALAIVARNVELVQDTLKRQDPDREPFRLCRIRRFHHDARPSSWRRLVERTGCGLLLDVNNVYVSAHNLGFDAGRFIDTLPAEAIGEIHLAGHAVNQVGDDTVLIDDHGSRVPPSVWSLYADAIRKFGPRPTLIEWDTDVPVLDVLLGEAMWADMLVASIEFGRRTTMSAPAKKPTGRQIPIVLPFEPRPSRPGMPVLAAFEAARTGGLAAARQSRRNGHADA